VPPEKIPVTFYIWFDLKNSLMALASGLILEVACPQFILEWFRPAPILLLIFIIIPILIYQFYAYSYFFGERRGVFEYMYRQRFTDRRIKKVLDGLTFTFSDEKSVLNYAPTIAIPMLLKKIETEPDPSLKSDIYMALAWAAAKEDQHQKAIEYLQEAVTLKQNDLVASTRLGQSWERLEKGEEAIRAYEMALRDPSLDSQPLKEFVSSQIERVKIKGPQKGMPYHYLRYIRG
jgi:tetratricopeptide (TPR) repeat protein